MGGVARWLVRLIHNRCMTLRREFDPYQTLSKKLYPHWSVLFGFRNVFERDLHKQTFYVYNQTKINKYKLKNLIFKFKFTVPEDSVNKDPLLLFVPINLHTDVLA